MLLRINRNLNFCCVTMNKVTNNDIIQYLVKKANLNKDLAEKFVNAFADAFLKQIKEEGKVDIKGLGSFKTVKMAARESINVNDGKRIVIPEYNRISFVPDLSAEIDEPKKKNTSKNDLNNEHVNGNVLNSNDNILVQDEDRTEKNNNLVVDNANTIRDKSAESEIFVSEEVETESIQSDNPITEKPVDEFSGIDVLISTPESLNDVKSRYYEATSKLKESELNLQQAQEELKSAQNKLNAAIEAKNQADKTVQQLALILDNTVNNKYAIIEREEDESETIDVDDDALNNKKSNYNENVKSENSIFKNNKLYLALVVAIVLAFAIVLILTGRKSSDASDNNRHVNQIDSVEINKTNTSDSINISNNSDTVNNNNNDVDTVVFDGYTPFEIIVTDHYGDRKHMKEVLDYNIEHNAFKDWRSIPVGSKILLPKFY